MNPTFISPSQLVDHLSCPRRRWFDKVVRLPKLERRGQASADLGTCLHAVAERYLLASDTGRNPDGSPVDLFPPGWETINDRGRKATISAADAAWVQTIVRQGIELGVLRRLPGREVEVPYKSPVIPGVVISGKIDQRQLPPRGAKVGVVEDHKTTKSRRWALTKDTLSRDPKMLCYAWETLQKYPDLTHVVLRLNYFCKDPVASWEVTTDPIPRDEVSRFWESTVVPSAREMLDWEVRGLTEDQFLQVEGPRSPSACSDYGGCAFAAVCTGEATPAQLRERVSRRDNPLSGLAGTKNKTIQQNNTMSSLFKKTPAPSPTQTPAPTPSPTQTAPAPTQTPTQEVPPWATPGCKVPSCKTTPGFNSKGAPCRACDLVSKREKRPTSDAYEVSVVDGKFTWALKPFDQRFPEVTQPEAGPNGPLAETPAQPVEPAPEKPKRQRKTKAVVESVSVGDLNQTTISVTGADVLDAKLAEQSKQSIETLIAENKDQVIRTLAGEAGKPILGLFVGCVPTGIPVEDLSVILAREGAEMAESMNATSYFELDAFKRRDALAYAASKIAESLRGKMVVSFGTTPDEAVLLTALVPHAHVVVRSTR